MFFLYQIFFSIILFISPLIIAYRIFKNKEDKSRFVEKLSIPSKKRLNGKLIWLHGASVGEILSVIPLIKYYEKNKNIRQILITSSTLSSSKVIKKFKFKKTIHQFYPIDYYPITNKFLNFWKPDLGIFIDSEIWPSMFKNMNLKKIPLLLLNARITKKTFKKWMKIKCISKSIFEYIKIAYPQNLETKSYLRRLSNCKIKHIGNLKFSENYDSDSEKINIKLKSYLIKKKIWVASSTHKSEEIFCAKAHLELKKKYKNILTVIIPRHVHRADKIRLELENLGLTVFLHSSKLNKPQNLDIYLVDTFGETKKFHKISSTVFLGGSIIKRGGQNPLEAARFGAKILHGPNTDNFRDVYKLLNSLGISKRIYSSKKLASSISFVKNKKGGKQITNIGEKILKKTIKELNNHIFHDSKKT